MEKMQDEKERERVVLAHHAWCTCNRELPISPLFWSNRQPVQTAVTRKKNPEQSAQERCGQKTHDQKSRNLAKIDSDKVGECRDKVQPNISGVTAHYLRDRSKGGHQKQAR